jgi:hypothetical protein
MLALDRLVEQYPAAISSHPSSQLDVLNRRAAISLLVETAILDEHIVPYSPATRPES